MKKIFLIGATDRFNYGDLLFPIIIKKKLEDLAVLQKDSLDIENYSLQNSDFTAIGGLPTKSYYELYKDIKNNECIIIIVGGEVIGSNWFTLYSFLDWKFYLMSKFHHKIKTFYESILVKLLINPQFKYPFIIDKNWHTNIHKVIYNAVGGSINKKDAILFLKQGDYISVRSKQNQKNLAAQGLYTNLSPDSAIIMSTIWKIEDLLKMITIPPLQNNFFFFQINKEYLRKNNLNDVCKIIEKIAEITKLNIVLCPIGTALGHEDHIALKRISKQLKVGHTFFTSPTLWDIMYLISSAQFYIGTSLHGVITAMSYNTPYVALQRSPKITDYLESWGIEELKSGANFSNLIDFIAQISKKDLNDKLEQSSKKMIALADQSFQQIFEICN